MIKKVSMTVIKTAIFLTVFVIIAFLLQVYFEKQEKTEIRSSKVSFENFDQVKFDTSKANPLYIDSRDKLTLENQKTEDVFISKITELPYKANAIGTFWVSEDPRGTSTDIEVRAKIDGHWEEWKRAPIDDANGGKNGPDPDRKFADLLMGDNIEAFQYKAILKRDDISKSPVLKKVGFNYIDSKSGPEPVGQSDKGLIQNAKAAPNVISRADWGCPEAYGTPRWSPEHESVTHAIVHHTAGGWSASDPASSVRAIWSYHANTRGWGDIGYNYIIDGYGNIYEGRYGGENVVGGHAYPYNRGTVGVSIMGDYTGSDISGSARNGLVDLIGKKFADRGIDPIGSGSLYAKNTVGGGGTTDAWGRTSTWVHKISGHRDVAQTSCPGQAFYNTFGNENWGVRYWAKQFYMQYRSTIGISAYTVSPSSPAMGETVTVSFTARNLLSSNNTVDFIGVASRFGGLNTDFGYSSNVTFASGESKNFSFTARLNRWGTYNTWISYKQDGAWRGPATDSGVPGGINVSTHKPDVKVTQAPSLNPTYPLLNQESTISFKLHNYDSRPATLSSITAATRYNGQNKDFQGRSVTIQPGADYTYTAAQTFTGSGQYSSWVSVLWPDGNWRALDGQGVSNSLNFGVYQSPANPKVTSSLAISPQDPVIGQQVTASFKVKNFGDQPAYFYRIGAALRFDPSGSNTNRDFTWREEVIPGNTEKTLSYSQTLNSSGDYASWISQYNGSIWQAVPKLDGSINDGTTFHVYQTQANPKVTSSLSISPQDPVIGQQVTASFKVRNFGDQPARFGALGVAVRFGNQPTDFDWQSNVINGNQEKTITLTKTFDSPGNYSAWVSARWPAGYWSAVPADTGIQASQNFYVADIFDKIRISSFSLSPTSPVVGDEVTTTVEVTNLSSASFSIF